MNQIRIHTERVKEMGQRLIARGDRLAEMRDELRSAIRSLDTGSWDGRSRHEAEPLLNRVRPESTHVAEALDALGRTLMHVAEVFEREDNTAAHNLDGLSWVDFEISAGQVLGISSGAGLAAPVVMLANTNVPLDEYRERDVSSMSWDDLLAYKEILRKKIEELNKEQQRLETLIAQEDQDIAEIDRQIRKLQAQRDALREEADKFSNKLKPDDDGLRWGFDDGILDAPWRTESDDMEDQIADLDQQIEDLQEQKQDLIAQRQDHRDQLQGIDQRLKSVRAEQEKLNGLYEPRYDGTKPAPGMNSVYGKPGQLPLDAPVRSDVNNRSFVRYQDVIDQFAVGNNPRYAVDSNTYCNTFAGDVARAMKVPLPQKREFGMNPRDQATIGFPQMWDYFTDPNAPVTAASDGWRQTGDLGTITNHVNSGKMAVAVNNGHIAVLKPGQGDGVNNINDLIVSQAGGINSNNLTLADGFGSTPTPQIYIID